MKKFLRRYFPLLPVLCVLVPVTFSHSCANTTTPPSGGKKDTIPPKIMGLSPLPGTTNVPVHGAKIEFEFDEYVTVKNAANIYLSPPQKKSPKYKMKGKKLIVYFEEDLLPNTTYTLDLTGAIADNNEGNMFPGYTVVFSTGDRIDNMVVTGTVLDCNTLAPVKDATVMLYKDLADSAVLKNRPDAAVKTDDWGYFAIRNVEDCPYRLYAIKEETVNNIYDPDNDYIAFCDSVIRPTMEASDTLKELLKYDMEDTLHCTARISEHELLLFKERPSKQMIKNNMRISPRSAYITFMASDAKIDSLWIAGLPQDRLITQFNPRRDSLEIWVNDRRRQPDTLHLYVDYLKTDTAGVLSPYTEHVRIASEKKTSARTARKNVSKEDTLCVVTVKAESETVEQNGFDFEFKYPLIWEAFDECTLTSINPRQQEENMSFTVERDTNNLRHYTLMPKGELKQGYEYTLKVPHRRFRDINGFYNDSTQVKVSLPKEENLSTLSLELSGVSNKYIVELLSEKKDRVLRTYIVDSPRTLMFPYLKEGKYSIRLTEDLNRNGIVDTGVLLEHKQPEKVRFYKLRDGSTTIEIKENTEITQKLNVERMFSE